MTSELWQYAAVNRRQIDETEFEEVEEKYRPKFKHNHNKIGIDGKVARHPYKIFRDIVTSDDRSTGVEMIVIEALKDEYTDKWERKIGDIQGEEE